MSGLPDSHPSPAEEHRAATRGPSVVLVAVTSCLLAGYLGVVGWAWSSTSDDPQVGMAVGFLMLVTLFLLGLAGLLAYAAAARRPRLAWAVFVVCALPSLSLVGRGVYLLMRWLGAAS